MSVHRQVHRSERLRLSSAQACCRGLEQRPDHRGLRVARGRYLLHMQQPDAALAEFRAALATAPDVAAYNGAAMACMQARKPREALMHARAATRAMPQHPAACCLLGLVHLQVRLAALECRQRTCCVWSFLPK